jgi:hypothetical protein
MSTMPIGECSFFGDEQDQENCLSKAVREAIVVGDQSWYEARIATLLHTLWR